LQASQNFRFKALNINFDEGRLSVLINERLQGVNGYQWPCLPRDSLKAGVLHDLGNPVLRQGRDRRVAGISK